MRRRPLLCLLSLFLPPVLLAGCALPGGPGAAAPPDILLLGERHDAPGQVEPVAALLREMAGAGRLAAFAVEMAPAGRSTVALPRDASAAAVRQALAWNDRAWPWERYAPAVLQAVADGVPVIGANLPQAQMAAATADVSLDAQLEAGPRARLASALREGHCGLLPESRIPALLRIQIARDRSMAHVLAESAVAGRTAVLLAGSAHADLSLGVPLHLPTHLTVRSIALVAEGDQPPGRFDERRASPAAPAGDPCASLARPLRDKPAR